MWFSFWGGGIATNGEIGIVTEELMSNRNPSLSKEKIEKMLKDALDLKGIIWLEKGLYADETCGHADEVVAFKSKSELLLNWTEDKTDKNYLSCREHYEKIISFCKNNGIKLKIYKIYGHKPLTRKKKEVVKNSFRNIKNPVAISYINFLLFDDVVILPQFGVNTDRLVYKQFINIFKGYKIIKFNTREISLGGGGIHCVTKTY